ncbi:MAG: spermidine synthase, partial [Planctomycetota bacterium]
MKILIFGCFLLSGVSGLIFEVVWIRMLGLVFGTSNFAITTVLTSFMAGLALGSFFTGRLSDRKNYNTLRGYGILEILVGCYGATTPILCSYLMQQYAFFYERFSPNFYLFSLSRFFVLFLILLPPTVLMGSTLPLLCKFLTSRTDHQVGFKIGLLYGINTLGAVVGTLLAGFILIPFLGVLATIYIATSISILAGISAIVLSFRISPDSFHSSISSKNVALIQEKRPQLEVTSSEFRFMLFGFACSGAIALAYETGWSRVLILILGGAVYSFTTMLATFLLGLALGALVMARILDRNIHRAKEWFCGLQWCIGMSAFATMHLFHYLPEWYVDWVYQFHENFTLFHVMKCLLAGSIMFLPTLGLGMMFPLMARIKVNQGEIGRAIGDVYSINTLGSILGAFGMGFIVMPLCGVSASLMLCVFGNLLLAGIGWIVLKKSKWLGFAGLWATLLFCLSFLPVWDPSVMTSGVFRYAPSILKDKEEARESAKYIRRHAESSFVEYTPPELRFYQDGLTCTVSVHQRGNSLVLKVNGKPDASSHADLFTQMMEAHLPMLLSTTHEETMVIGLATGITTGSVACYPNQRVTCLEIEESMLSAAKLFAPYNRNVMQQREGKAPESSAPVEFKIIDARNYLLGMNKQYSVIVSSPSHPWLSGGANLFTKEFFKLCKQRLKPDGILCQWLQLYEISWETLQVLLNTLRSEFPHLVFFHSDSEVLLVLASQQEISLDWKRISERMKIPAVREDLARLGITHPAHIIAHYITSTSEASSLLQTPFYNTDDNAYVEFITPRQIFANVDRSQEILKKFRDFTPCPLRSWIASIPLEERMPVVLEYMKKFLETRHYSDLLAQETVLYELFSGEERGQIAGWLGLETVLFGKK